MYCANLKSLNSVTELRRFVKFWRISNCLLLEYPGNLSPGRVAGGRELCWVPGGSRKMRMTWQVCLRLSMKHHEPVIINAPPYWGGCFSYWARIKDKVSRLPGVETDITTRAIYNESTCTLSAFYHRFHWTPKGSHRIPGPPCWESDLAQSGGA